MSDPRFDDPSYMQPINQIPPDPIGPQAKTSGGLGESEPAGNFAEGTSTAGGSIS